MILITKIEYKEVPYDVWRIAHYKDLDTVMPVSGDMLDQTATYDEEVIRGREYRSIDYNGNKKSICLTLALKVNQIDFLDFAPC